jgi:hypothetical protein
MPSLQVVPTIDGARQCGLRDGPCRPDPPRAGHELLPTLSEVSTKSGQLHSCPVDVSAFILSILSILAILSCCFRSVRCVHPVYRRERASHMNHPRSISLVTLIPPASPRLWTMIESEAPTCLFGRTPGRTDVVESEE